jgi:alpha-ribazole phosphatase
MSDHTRILLVRHAQPTSDARGRCYGALDIGFSARGRAQAQLLACTLEQVPLAAIYTSPSRRAVDSAAPAAQAHALTPIIDERLRELDFGDFEGRTYGEIERSNPERYRQWMDTPTLVQFPGGESYTQLRARALAAIDAIRARHLGETAAVFSHGGVLRTILADCLSMPADAIFRLDQRHGAISIIDWIDTTPLVRLLNAPPTTLAADQRGFISALGGLPCVASVVP